MAKTRHQQIRHNTTLAIFIAIILLQDFVPFFWQHSARAA